MKKDQSSEGKRTVQALTISYLAPELSNTKWKLAFSKAAPIKDPAFHEQVDSLHSRQRIQHHII